MFNIFKKKPTQEVEVAVKVSKMDSKAIIEQIHNEFAIAGETLLKQATELLNKGIEGNPEKAKLLAEIGFTSTKEYEKIREQESKIAFNKRIAENIRYFQINYPNNKVITEEMVASICKKYNLVKGPITRYTGFVPEVKLQEIAKFGLKEEDYSYVKFTYGRMGYNMKRYITIDEYEKKQTRENEYNHEYHENYEKYKEPLEICAPLKDMDTKGMELKGYKLSKIEIPDPVVLQPVIKNGITYYLILTCWGDEASDELVVNNKMN